MRHRCCAIALLAFACGCFADGVPVVDTDADSTGAGSSTGTSDVTTTPDPTASATSEPSSSDATGSGSTADDGSSSGSSSSGSSDTEPDATSNDPDATGDPSSGSSSDGETGLDTDCPELALGGFALQGSTAAEDDDVAPSCANGGADATIAWAAPVTGSFRFTTNGSAYDAVIAVLAGSCDGAELACDDDSAMGVQAQVEIDLLAGDEVVIVVDGHDGASGFFDLSIVQTDSSCCYPDGEPGCVEEDVVECTCALSPGCCDFEWDVACVQLAVESCGLDCAASCDDDGAACDDPAACSCQGCVDDGLCDDEEDCVCPDCLGVAFCGCDDDQVCDVADEDCSCYDCVGAPSCNQ